MTDSWPKYLSQKTLMKIARKVVREKGHDYNYRRENSICVYVKDGMPSCLVGQILIEFSPEIKDLLIFRNTSPIGDLFNNPYFQDKIGAHPTTIDALCVMQSAQDHGRTWGTALKEGLAHFNK